MNIRYPIYEGVYRILTNKQVFKVKTVIEKALNKKQDVKKKRNTHPKL